MKKLSPSLIGFLFALVVSVLSMVLYFNYIEKERYYLIDNPTEATIYVNLDGEEYVISPRQHIRIKLNRGEHNLAVSSDVDSLNFPQTDFLVRDVQGLINPTRSVYFTFAMPYGPMVDKDSIFGELHADYQGKTYYGDIQIDSSVYNESFYYNLDEKFPKITRKSDNKELRVKIFRVGDFKQFYFENYE